MRWTVIVCTYNRGEDLAETLEGLDRLDYDRGRFEIVVVDNASTDETPAVIRAAAVRMANLSAVRAEKPGLSNARNVGLAEARGELVAFIDDDAVPDAGWLQALEEGFADDGTACVGGKVEACWPASPPLWLADRLYGFFSVVDYGPQRRYLSYPNYPAGTNVAFRKSALTKVGNFNEQLGRVGSSLVSMEEVDICLRIEDGGAKIGYIPDAVVHHKIHAGRVNKEWINRRSYCQGVSAAVLEGERFSTAKMAAKLAKYVVFIVGGTLGGVFFRLAGNDKLSFFCSNQVILCQGYLKQYLSSHRKSSR